MKKLLTIFVVTILALSTLCFVGCGGKAKSEEQKHFESVVQYLKSSLKDPDSLKISFARGKLVTEITESELFTNDARVQVGDYVYNIKYNAKNSFGGYAGEEDIYYVYHTSSQTLGKMGAFNYIICEGEDLSLDYSQYK